MTDICKLCGVRFDPLRSLGQWECRMHALEPYRPTYDTCNVYPCCGMRQERVVHAKFHWANKLPTWALGGCLRVDHVGQEDKDRTAADMVLFGAHNKDRIAPYVPADRIVTLCNTDVTEGFTLAEVRDQPEVPIRVAVAAPRGGSVEKDIRANMEEIICDAYGDMRFVQNSGSIYGTVRALRQNPSLPSLEFPEGIEETALVSMSDDTYVTFQLLYDRVQSTRLPVTIMAVRRADKVLDKDVLQEVERDNKR